MKKATIWMLVAMMLMAMLAGCAQPAATTTPAPADDAKEPAADVEAPAEDAEETEEPAEDAEEPAAAIDISETMELEVSFCGSDDAWGPEVEIDKFGQFIMDKFNVTFKSRNVTWGDYGEKANLWAASNDLPGMTTVDIVGGTTFFQWINEGVVRALPSDDVMQQFPTLYYNMNTAQVKAFRVNGVAYHMPRMTYPNPDWYCMDDGVYYRKDWLEALNLEWPTNEQEFIDMCVAFATQDPDGNGKDDTIGMGTITDPWPLWQPAFPQYGYNQGNLLVDENGVVTHSLADDDTLKVMSFYRKLNKAGGFDPDFLTNASDDDTDVKFCAGITGVYVRQTSPQHIWDRYKKWCNLQPDKDWFECVGIVSADMWWDVEGVKDWGRINPTSHWSEYYFASDVSDELLMRYLLVFDWMSSDEGMRFMGYGFEGEDWEYDEDGNMVSLLGTKEDGTAITISDKYNNAKGASMCVWTGDMTQYINPNIPVEIRTWATAERDRRIEKCPAPSTSFVLNSINTDEKMDNTANPSSDWELFITDTSDKTDEELFAEMKVKWEQLGLYAMLDSLTAEWQANYMD